jgi:catechol 2,3-dioxygenase-like lactoylglutathione lyase family enzyme
MIKTNGLTHIHLMVADLEQSVGFYHRVFGMQELFRQGAHMVFLRTPGSDDMITLHQRHADEPTGAMGSIAHFGFHHAEGTDLDSAVAEIIAAGGSLVERGTHGGNDPYAYVADPDGYVIEI